MKTFLLAAALCAFAFAARATPGAGDPPEITTSSGTIHVVIPPDWAQPAK